MSNGSSIASVTISSANTWEPSRAIAHQSAVTEGAVTEANTSVEALEGSRLRVGKSGMWASGDAYEQYVGRWSRLVARDFVGWLPATVNTSWVDVGCGTGALSEAILQVASPSQVAGVDPSESYLAVARERVGGPWTAFQVASAQALPFKAQSFDM